MTSVRPRLCCKQTNSGRPYGELILNTKIISSTSVRLAITCDLLEAREKSRVQGATDFGFASNRLKNRREIFKPITKRDDRNRVTTMDRHLKTALMFKCFKIACR